MKLLDRQNILKRDDIQRSKVEIPEWDGFVFVQTMTAKARDEYESKIYMSDGTREVSNARAKYIAATCCDEEGNLLFTQEDIGDLGGKRGDVMDRIFEAAWSINKMKQSDLDELIKNSETDQDEDSSSS